MKKKIISIALLGATTSLMALGAEHAYLYKDARIMGMGGANVAVGGYSTSVFSNPAGLANIKKDHGFVVDLLGLGVSTSENTSDFISDIDEASEDKNGSQILAIHSLDQLKDKIAKVIVMVLVVNFFQRVLHTHFTTPLEMLYFALSIAALSIGLYFLGKVGKK